MSRPSAASVHRNSRHTGCPHAETSEKKSRRRTGRPEPQKKPSNVLTYRYVTIYLIMMTGEKRELIDLTALDEAAQCLRTLAHPHRLRMVDMLLSDEHTVGELAEACGIQSHMASEHLRMMKDRGLLSSRREGRRTYYRIEDRGLASIIGCVRGRYGASESGRTC